ncbi:MAG: Thiamine-monophosphate kinase [Candidatus Gallionella acididurans]|uniref:Thiamine-monophosphate kinase n=1 Tax=Candidatus Gallionella acididurans TaxID=1796491 RepID=A0A139BX60_9PROT|nr:MAG: Thiamine-monophosphate kinase [Candidatus Gallionella acididurans]
MTEFDLIRRYFTRATPGALLGVGDDAALLRASAGSVLAVSSDMLVSGTHFFPDAEPFLLGHKTLAVNLSDMAAMGAQPRWATLAIALPSVNNAGADDAWLEKFSAGFFSLAQRYGVELVGGDTTRGPLNLCVTIMGEVPQGGALLRSGAQAGDEIWVSGYLGDAALALAHLQGRIALSESDLDICAQALHRPQPRVELGLALRGIASSAIDISDGLLADLGHILEASRMGAQIDLVKLPASRPVAGYLGQQTGIQCVLAGGDDYELCFTAHPARHAEVSGIAAKLKLPLTNIGTIVARQGCIVFDAAGNPLKLERAGYEHFR